MINRLNFFSFKILLYAMTATLLCATPSLAKDNRKSDSASPILDMIQKKENDAGKTMKSTSFTTSPNKKNDETKDNDDNETENKPEIGDIEDADLDESLESISDDGNKSKSAEQKLWDAYKAMKTKTADEKEKDSKNEDSKETDAEKLEEEEEEEEEEAKSEDDSKKNTGLTKIIEDYKNSQKGKGSLNSRSFGSID